MPVFNYPQKEVNVKVVYYGPGLSGKTTNLQKIHEGIKPEFRGKLVSLATQTDRTLFFDFMPMELGSLGGYKVRLHLYTVPGQVHYNATRKLVLKGVDGVVFVADSQKAMTDANVESILNLEKNLQSYGKSLVDLPHVIQANKRDLEEVISMEEVNSLLNHHGAVVTEAVASDGNGALETLTEIVRLVMRGLRDQFAAGMGGVTETHPEPRSIEEKPSEAESADVPEGDPGSAPDPVPTQIHQAPPPASEPMAEGEDADDEVQDEPIPELLKAEFEEAREPIPDHEPNENGVEVDGDASPIKLIVPVDGIGTLELAIRISARVLEEGERKALKIDVTRAALVEHALASEPEVTDAAVVHADETPATLPETGIESEPLAEPETDAEVLEVKTDLPPLGGQAEEPLGSPLDGQESEDLYIPELPQTEKILLEEDLDAVEPEPSSPEPVSGYDPTLQPLDFDFPETEPEEEAPKKGLFGRFKKKQ